MSSTKEQIIEESLIAASVQRQKNLKNILSEIQYWMNIEENHKKAIISMQHALAEKIAKNEENIQKIETLMKEKDSLTEDLRIINQLLERPNNG